MAVNFCTMPTQHGKLGYFFSKADSTVKVSKNYISIMAVCYASIAATAFPGSAVI